MERTHSSRSVKRKESSSSKGGENFKVAVRVRPLIVHEMKDNVNQCVDVDDEHKAVIITKPESRRKASHIGIDDFGELVRSDANLTHNFFFDRVFGPSCTQEVVFDVCVREIVESVLQGYNGSVIASGQTSSGKTYTIEGELGEAKGIIPRAAELIFQYIEDCPRKNDRFLVRTSFLEIYNEKISDLMDPSRENLKIREDGLGGVYVEGLSEHVVRNTDGVISLLRKGAHLRTTATTKMNKESSRSHAVFTVIVEHAEYDSSGGSVVTIGKLRMVDLAGSERLDMEAQSKLQEETKNINVSLHTFGKVVTALTTAGVKHVPYRDSKLTRLLQDCLGGNCKTTLVATITPVASCYTESLNTLKFAKRAKSIKNTALVNKDISQKALLSAYQQEIKKLKSMLQDRDFEADRVEMERLEREKEEAEKEKEEVLSQLQAQRKFMSEAQAERNRMLQKISQLEEMIWKLEASAYPRCKDPDIKKLLEIDVYVLVLHGHSSSISESEEFKKAVQKEHARIRHETETEFQMKIAELETEKKRLQNEREEVERQKEYFSKLRADFQPDGQKADDSPEELEQGPSSVKTPSYIAPYQKTNPLLRDTKLSPGSLVHRTSPSGAYIPSGNSSFPKPPNRISSAEVLPSRASHISAGTRRNSYTPPHSANSGKYEMAYPLESVVVGMTNPLDISGLKANIQLDGASANALREYALALAHPQTGIPCQDVSGIHIFTGSTAVKWFMKNMEGVISVQVARNVGQRLMDLNVFTEIQGGNQFIISDTVYYQFCETALTSTPPKGQFRINRAVSSPHLTPYSASSCTSLQRYGTTESVFQRGQLACVSGHSSTWEFSSTTSLDQSLSSLHNGGDLLEHFGLTAYAPTPLHIAAINGDRSKLKLLANQESNIDCLDAVGHTPLMYAVMAKHSKCCLQLIRLGADVNATSLTGQTPLLLATIADHSEIIKLLLKNGAQTHFTDQQGQTAFHITAKSQSHRCLEYLCKYAAALHGINERDHAYHTPLHVAVLNNLQGNTKCLLVAKADLGVSDEKGLTALHYAVSQKSFSCVRTITETAPNDINLVDTSGQSALHLACQRDSVELVNSLLSQSSCDINLRDQRGLTPLHISVVCNSPETTKVLVQRGANVTIKDNQGKTPLHYCMEMGFAQCAKAIQTSS